MSIVRFSTRDLIQVRNFIQKIRKIMEIDGLLLLSQLDSY